MSITSVKPSLPALPLTSQKEESSPLSMLSQTSYFSKAAARGDLGTLNSGFLHAAAEGDLVTLKECLRLSNNQCTSAVYTDKLTRLPHPIKDSLKVTWINENGLDGSISRTIWGLKLGVKGGYEGDTALHLAARGEHENIAKYLCENFPSLVETPNEGSETPIFQTLRNESAISLFKTFLSYHAKCSVTTHDGLTPLHLLAGAPPVFDGVDGRQLTELFKTALGTIEFYKNEIKKRLDDHFPTVLTGLIGSYLEDERKSALNSQIKIGKETPLHYAISNNHKELVEYLRHDPDVDLSLKDYTKKSLSEALAEFDKKTAAEK